MDFPRAVVFDWDNTLVDSWERIQCAYNATFRHFGMPEWGLEETTTRVAKSLRDSFPQMFGSRWEEARDVFYAAVEATADERPVPLDGAEDLLLWLVEKGVVVAVVSNKKGEFLRREAELLGWSHLFCALVGAGDVLHDKPHPLPLIEALKPAGLTPDSTVWFVGDSEVDVLCGQSGGCRTILLRPHGQRDAAEKGVQPDRCHPDCRDLLRFMRKMGDALGPSLCYQP